MPSAIVSRTIAASPAEVWAVLSDVANARRWNPPWSKIETTSNQTQGSGTRFRAHTSEGDAFEFEITGWVAPEYIEFSPIRDDSERHGIVLESHAFRLQLIGEDATQVELTARASTHGIRGRFVALFLWRGYQKQGLNAALDALQAVVEPERESEPDTEAEATSAND